MTETKDVVPNEDMAFQEREWRVERIGWVGLLVVVVLSALGLFGRGPVSSASVSSDDRSIEVSFERFGRRGGPQDLVVTADSTAAENGTWKVELSRELLDTMRIDSTTPQPDSVASVPGGVRYTFAQAESTAELEARFSVTPKRLWKRSGEIGLADGETVAIGYFLFP